MLMDKFDAWTQVAIPPDCMSVCQGSLYLYRIEKFGPRSRKTISYHSDLETARQALNRLTDSDKSSKYLIIPLIDGLL